MSGYAYVVRCAFDDREAMEGFLGWLRDHHVSDVCAAGANGAEIVRLDPGGDRPYAVEVWYRFASRDAFSRYEREEAPRLRAEALAQIAQLGLPRDGVTFTRWTGELVPWRAE